MIKLDFSKFDLNTMDGLYGASLYCVDEASKYNFLEGFYTLYEDNVEKLIKEGCDTSKHFGLMKKDYSSEKRDKFRAAYDAYGEKCQQLCEEANKWEAQRELESFETEEELARAKERFEYEKNYALKEGELFDEFYAEIEKIIKE